MTELGGSDYPDKRERWNMAQLVFLGGFWESAGGIGVSRVEGRKGRWEYQPYMNYGANDEALIRALMGVYGGTFVSGTNSWEWQIAGQEAINLAKVMTEANEYKVWIENPEFVAGVMQATASVYWVKHRGRGTVYPNAKIISKNDSLLTALEGEFGGKKERSGLGGRMLVLNATQTRAILDFSGDHLLYRNRTVKELRGETGFAPRPFE